VDERRFLQDHRLFLRPSIRAELVPDTDVETVALGPLREFAVRERLTLQVAECRVPARDPFDTARLRVDLEYERGSHESLAARCAAAGDEAQQGEERGHLDGS
jgi:hypothetical protein